MKKLTLNCLSVFLFLASCNHSPVNSKIGKEWQPISSSKYNRLILKNTKSKKEYKGLFLVFESEVTFLSSKIHEEQMKMKSQYQYLDFAEATKAKQEMLQDLSKNTYFFLNFYSPNKKLNKLNQKAFSWKAILRTADGREHKGSIQTQDKVSNYNTVFFPHTETWSKSYKVTFDLPTKSLDDQRFTLKILGPPGMAVYKF